MCMSCISVQQQPKGKCGFFNGGMEMGFAILPADLLFLCQDSPPVSLILASKSLKHAHLHGREIVGYRVTYF